MAKTTSPKIVTKKHQARLQRENTQRRYILFGAIAVIILVIGFIGFGVLDQLVLQYNQPVAKVNDTTITSGQFQNEVRFERYQTIQTYMQYYSFYSQFEGDPFGLASTLTKMQSQLNDDTAMGEQALEKLIEDVLIADFAKANSITVSDEEITKAMQESFGYYANGTPTPTVGITAAASPTYNPTTLAIVTLTPTATNTSVPTATATSEATPTAVPPTATPTVASTPSATETPMPTATPYTEAGFEEVKKQYLGELSSIKFSEADLRAYVKASLLRDKVKEFLTKDLKPEREEAWIRHILVADETTAQSVYERLMNGEDFGTVAKEVSTDSTAANGGDLGWLAQGDGLDADFEAAAFALPVGEISKPVATQFGYHIIQVIDKGMRSLDQTGFNSYKASTFSTWLTDQKNTQKIEKYDLWMQRIPADPTLPAAYAIQ